MKSRINWFLHLRSIYYLRLSRMSTHKMQCEFAQYLKKGPTVGESNTWITQKTSLRNHWPTDADRQRRQPAVPLAQNTLPGAKPAGPFANSNISSSKDSY